MTNLVGIKKWVLGAGVLFATAGTVIGDPAALVLSEGRSIELNGSWRVAGATRAAAAPKWNGQIDKIQGRRFEGSVSLPIGDRLVFGNIHGKVSWKGLSGDVTTTNGDFIGEFSGALDVDGASGTYTLADGSRGDWTWDIEG